MQPALYLWRGKAVVQFDVKSNYIATEEMPEKNWRSPTTWLTTAAAVILLLPATILGAALKSIAYLLSSQVQKRYRDLRINFEYNQWKNSLDDIPTSQLDHARVFVADKEKILFLSQLISDLRQDPHLLEKETVQDVLQSLLTSFPFSRGSNQTHELQREILFFILSNPNHQTFFIEALAQDPLSGAEKITSFFTYPLSKERKMESAYFSLVSIILNQGYEALPEKQKTVFSEIKFDFQGVEKQIFAIAFLAKDSDDQKALKMIHNELLLLYLERREATGFRFQIPVQIAVEGAVYYKNSKDNEKNPHEINLTSKQMAQLIEEGPLIYSFSMLTDRPSLKSLVNALAQHPNVLKQILEEPALSPLAAWHVIGFLEPALIEDFKPLLKEKISTSFEVLANFLSKDTHFKSDPHRDLNTKDLQDSHFDLLYEVMTEKNIQSLQSGEIPEGRKILSRLLQNLPKNPELVKNFISFLDDNTIVNCFYGTPMHVLPHLIAKLSFKENNSDLKNVFRLIVVHSYPVQGRFEGFYSSNVHLEILLPFLNNPSQSWKISYLWKAFTDQAIKKWINPSGHPYPEEKLIQVHSFKTFLEWRRMRRDAPRGEAFQADDWLVSQLETSGQRWVCDQILFNLNSYYSFVFKMLTYFEFAKIIFYQLSVEEREFLLSFRDEVLAELESTKDTDDLPCLLHLEGLKPIDQKLIIENLSQLPIPSLKHQSLRVAAVSGKNLDCLPEELRAEILTLRKQSK